MYGKSILVLLPFLLISCSSVNRMALSSAGKMIAKGSEQINHEPDWELFKESTGANLKTLETLSHTDPSNTLLLSLLIKGYAAHAFGVHETLYLKEKLQGIQESDHRRRAIWDYTKSYRYGLAYLQAKDFDLTLLESKSSAKTLTKELERRFDKQDRVALFYMAQALGGLINLQRDNVSMLTKLTAVKSIMDWTCSFEDDFELGACMMFYAIYEASRPAMLGGSMSKAKKLFEDFQSKYPFNLLARVSYLEHYVVPMMEEDDYETLTRVLDSEFSAWKNAQNFAKQDGPSEKYTVHPQFNLFNAIAFERYKAIKSLEDELF